MYINRTYDDLGQFLKPGKVVVIYGPRQVGKTTLIKRYLENTKKPYRYDTGDNILTRELYESQHLPKLLSYAEGMHLIALDEAQRIPGVGLSLKLLIDARPDLSIIATGSSSFELAGHIGEPLTGRKTTLTLYPLSQKELAKSSTSYDLDQALADRLLYGSYPAVVTAQSASEKLLILKELTESYLFKDILELERIRNAKILLDLLRLIAFQIGQEVSHHELAKTLGIDQKTVARYIDLLEKCFILYNLRAYSKNLRSEITTKSKYYFYDTGIRNALIANFNALHLRNDIGGLWENFLIMERIKKHAYEQWFGNCYFWRTYDQAEIDYIEEYNGMLNAFEFKWSKTKAKHAPKSFTDNYPDSTFTHVTNQSYRDFIV